MQAKRIKSRMASCGWILAIGASAVPVYAQSPPNPQPGMQEDGVCGTVVTQAHLEWLRKREEAGLVAPPPGVDLAGENDFQLTRVAVHIVRLNDGTGGVSIPTIAASLSGAAPHYVPARVVFYVVSLDFINNTAFYQGINTQAEIDALRAVNHVPGAINIYFTHELASENGGLCGQATFSPETGGIVVDDNCVGAGHSTFPHEIGHYFDLYHTHETAFGIDCPPDTPCESNGDKVCDTPADPGLHTCSDPTALGSCVNASCSYIGSETCPLNDSPYNPSTINIMSYSRDACRTEFAPGQHVRINDSARDARSDHVAWQSACSSIVYVDGNNAAAGDGSWTNPFKTIPPALTASQTACGGVPGLVSIRAGTYTTPSTFNTPATLVTRGGMVTITP